MRDSDPVWTRWEEIDRVFEAMIDIDGSERLAALQQWCGEDRELFDAVADLLDLSRDEDARATGPGEELVRFAWGIGSPAEVGGLAAGDEVGRYRILRTLGQGGMAAVFEAERSDGSYRQTVALKVLRRGLDTDRIVRRFVAERQILSDLAHPNIARLLDGGATEDGRPFLVMEKVDGEPLTERADRARLTVEDRLRLFLQLTEAVQEAHRRLVVHRDIKPSNVLVDARGRLKLLDFGIAKLLDDTEPDLTQTGTFPLTRRYASPEQLRGERVTTSSDVYQLGLVLYELLTGLRAFESDEEEAPSYPRPEPPPPSVAISRSAPDRAPVLAHRRATGLRMLQRRLRGDLDTIVGKALQPEALDRYRSVEDLDRDIRLHLEGRPIRAHPASRTLKARKWLGRNRWAPPVAALLALGVIGYTATITVAARQLERERNEARAQAQRAERIKGFLIGVFQSADPFEGTGDPAESGDVTVAEALGSATDRIRHELRDDPVTQADLLSAVASILENLDRIEQGRPLVEEALALRSREGLLGSPAAAGDLSVLSQIVDYEDPDSAAALLDRAIGILRETVPADDPRLAEALSDLFWLRVFRLRDQDPSLGEEALAIYEAGGPAYRGVTAAVLSTLAGAHRQAGRLREAEGAAVEALQREREAMGDGHPRTALAAVHLAGLLDDMQRFDEAIPLYREALGILDRTAGPTHNQTLTTRNNLATTLHQAGRIDEAVVMHREIVEANRQKAGTDIHQAVALSLQNLAAALKDGGSLREADSLAARAHVIYVRTTPPGSYLRAFPLLTRAEILLTLGDAAAAQRLAAEALPILEGALPAGHFAIGVARCRLGRALMAEGRADEAASHMGEALEMLRQDSRTPPDYVAECEGAFEDLDVAAAS